MKFTNSATVAILALSSQIAAQSHDHPARGIQHQHHHARQNVERHENENLDKRAVETVTEYQYITVDQDGVPWETQASFLQAADVGVKTPVAAVPSYSAPVAAEPPKAAVPDKKPKPEAKPSSSPIQQAYVASTDSSSSAQKLARDFPDGTLSCSSFPDEYGAMHLGYLGYDGWSGIQINNGNSNSCTEGGLCSYACPPGYSKTQWPADQPADGQSRGGLLCQNGKLTLTRPSVPKLCVKGQGSAQLVNNMSKSVAVCRTDYPGTENMVIPVSPAPGATEPLTVVISADYYVWGGKQTSAQYYVNKAGVSAQDGCIWGTPEAGVGNYAPLVFGAGYRDGDTWVSIFANPLANGADAGYNVKIVAAEGSTINGECSYENGQFSTAGGCTVCVTSGSANVVFTDRS